MSDNTDKLHFAIIKSELFKGRTDWYYCFLKAEKISHVLVLLSQKQSYTSWFDQAIISATTLHTDVLRFVKGEVGMSTVEGDMVALLAAVRMAQTAGAIETNTAKILLKEVEDLLLRFSATVHISPFVSRDDFLVDDVAALGESSHVQKTHPSLQGAPKDHVAVKDISKGQVNGSAGQGARAARILELVNKNKGVSIKDISREVRDCSEKTIQRELAALVGQGLVRKVGERRWSQYFSLS